MTVARVSEGLPVTVTPKAARAALLYTESARRVEKYHQRLEASHQRGEREQMERLGLLMERAKRQRLRRLHLLIDETRTVL